MQAAQALPPGIGAAWLEKHGKGPVTPECSEELRAALSQELEEQGFPTKVVRVEVAKFLQQCGHASPGNFNRLLRRVAHSACPDEGSAAGPNSARGSRAPSRGSVSSFSARPHTTRAAPEATPMERVQESAPGAGTRADPGIAKWSKIAKLERLLEAQDKDKQQAVDRMKKAEYRDSLTMQIEERRRLQQGEQQEKSAQRALADEDRKRFVAEENAKKVEVQNSMMRVKRDIDAQVACLRTRLQKEQKDSLTVGKKLADKASRELENEKQLADKRKQQQREEEAKQSAQWEEERRLRIIQRSIEREEQMKERSKLQEQVEQESKRAKEETKKALEERHRLFDELQKNKALAGRAKLIKRTERLNAEAEALEAVRRAEMKAAAEEQRKVEQRRKDQKNNVEFLQQQMKEKERSQTHAAELEKQRFQEQKAAYHKYVEAEQVKSVEQKSKKTQHQQDLKHQIDIKNKTAVEGSKMREDILSSVEISINRDTVQKIAQYALG